jgi:hypothetical protein
MSHAAACVVAPGLSTWLPQQEGLTAKCQPHAGGSDFPTAVFAQFLYYFKFQE